MRRPTPLLLLLLLLGRAAASRLLALVAPRGRPRLPPEALELTGSLATALAVKAVALDARYVPSESMVPTLEVGDYFLLDKLSLRFRDPKRGDVVCFRPPPQMRLKGTGLDGGSVCFVKRVVGVPGDRVCVRHGRLHVNGVAQREPYVGSRASYSMRATTVPSGHVFVLGDNRDASYDSHVWGALATDRLLGLALCTYWPLRRACGRAAYAGARRGERGRP